MPHQDTPSIERDPFHVGYLDTMGLPFRPFPQEYRLEIRGMHLCVVSPVQGFGCVVCFSPRYRGYRTTANLLVIGLGNAAIERKSMTKSQVDKFLIDLRSAFSGLEILPSLPSLL